MSICALKRASSRVIQKAGKLMSIYGYVNMMQRTLYIKICEFLLEDYWFFSTLEVT